ncbi:MAG TPA: glycosyltransferase [Flavipsychrobacter sp.]|nr:glycosyltransferase [Flavipsychrobacter sp.]
MHILILLSEEFVPKSKPLAGIFQHHQAKLLEQSGHKVGVISVKQEYSVMMLLKAILYRSIGKKTGNRLDSLTVDGLLKLAYKKLFDSKSFNTRENIENISILRTEGMFPIKPSDENNLNRWVNAGKNAFTEYVKIYGKPDIIHAHNALYAGILAGEIFRIKKIPYIITEHSTAFSRGLVKSHKLIKPARSAYKNAKKVFAVSKPFRDLLATQFENINFHYLPNVIDPDLESLKPSDLPQDDNKFVFLNIAVLHEKKNQQMLIEAFEIVLAETKKNVELWIGGAGDEMDNLTKYVSEKGLHKHVKLMGQLARKDVVNAIERSDCFVLSSTHETFGVVLIEAMLFGKPVIATRCGGPEGFVEDHVGVLVEKNNKEELVQAMMRMMKNAGKYDADTIRNFSIEEFGREAFLKKINKIYKEALLQ